MKVIKFISSLICVFFSFSGSGDVIETYNSVKHTDRLHALGHTTPFRKEYPETVLLLSQYGSYSALFVEPRVLVTAFHALEGVEWEGEKLPYAFQDMNTLDLVPIKHILALDPKHDLAFLEPEDGGIRSIFILWMLLKIKTLLLLSDSLAFQGFSFVFYLGESMTDNLPFLL